MALVFGALAPGNVQPAFGFAGKTFQRLAVRAVNRHPFAGRDDADDSVARQRMAAAGEMHRHPRNQPFNFQRFGIFLFNFAERRNLDRLNHLFQLGLLIGRINRFHHVPAADQSLAHFGINVVDRFRLKIGHHRQQPLFRKLQSFVLKHFFKNFLSENDKLIPFGRAHITADGSLGLAGNHEAFPLRRRMLGF